jgi:thiol-disulfide isomerase/thioredoxin
VLIGVLLVGVLLVSDCAVSTGDRAPANTVATGPDLLLDFTSVTVGGETFDGRQLAGKPAVLWFWAPWCPTCRAQTPAVSRLAETYRNRVNVVGWAAWTRRARSGTLPTASVTRSLC